MAVPTPRRGLTTPGWLQMPLKTSVPVRLTFAIALDNVSVLEDALWSASDPTSARYGQWWSIEQIAAVTGAPRRAEAVVRWLNAVSSPLSIDVTAGGEFVVASLAPPAAAAVLSVPLQAHRHASTGVHRHALLPGHEPRLPSHLQASVDFVSGVDLPQWRRPRPPSSAVVAAATARGPAASPNGRLEIGVVEARDRALQVHVALHWPAAWGTAPPVSAWEAVATPMRGREDPLPAVSLARAYAPSQCTTTSAAGAAGGSDEASAACVLTLGPSLGLVNYVPTALRMRVLWAGRGANAASNWTRYSDLAFPTKSMTPLDVRRLYGVPNGYTAPASAGNDNHTASSEAALGLANFLRISTDPAEATAFNELMGVPLQPAPRFVGDNNVSELVDVEGSIDLQWAQAVGWGVPTVYYAVDGGGFGHEPFLAWVVGLANESAPPRVHSISYGENEDDYDAAYEARVNLELLKLGLRGITLVAASGDTGVQGGAQQGGSPPRCAPFAPLWPASSPYVTAVGGTQFSDRVTNACSLNDVYAYGTRAKMPFACPDDEVGEIGCSTQTGAMITSGGGFSDRWARPRYQGAAVAPYLREGARSAARLPPAALFNASGRAYPDVAAVAQNVPVRYAGELQMVGGTSSAAPIVGALLALLNAERARLGLAPLGFANPWLYAVAARHPEAFNDVRAGNNSGGNRLLSPYIACAHGFAAAPGWDPVSGLGSPNYRALLAHAVPFGQASIEAHVAPPPVERGLPLARRAPLASADAWPLRTSQLVALCVACSAISAAVAAVTTLCLVWWLRRRSGARRSGDGLRGALLTTDAKW